MREATALVGVDLKRTGDTAEGKPRYRPGATQLHLSKEIDQYTELLIQIIIASSNMNSVIDKNEPQ